LKLLDTEVLIASLNKNHKLYRKAIMHLQSIRNPTDVFVLCLVFHECDLVLRKNRFSSSDRERIFQNLSLIIPKDRIVATEPRFLRKAANLEANKKAKGGLFDSLIASAALELGAEIISTDPCFRNMGVITRW
jgi:predicted nucleic acid-binding protein